MSFCFTIKACWSYATQHTSCEAAGNVWLSSDSTRLWYGRKWLGVMKETLQIQTGVKLNSRPQTFSWWATSARLCGSNTAEILSRSHYGHDTPLKMKHVALQRCSQSPQGSNKHYSISRFVWVKIKRKNKLCVCVCVCVWYRCCLSPCRRWSSSRSLCPGWPTGSW